MTNRSVYFVTGPYHGELSFLGERTLLPFDEYRAISFVEKWFGERHTDRTRADALITEIRNSHRIKELSSQPLLLCLMCNAIRRHSQISRRPTNIYQQCVDTLLWEWDSRRVIRRHSRFSNLDLEKKTWLHAQIAFFFQQNRIRYVERRTIEELIADILPRYGINSEEATFALNELSAYHGLIVKLTDRIIGFPHLALQEFLAARWLASEARWKNIISQQFIADPWWNHTLALTAGILSDATELIVSILTLPQVNELHVMLVVAECLKMDPVVSEQVRHQCLSRILNWYHNGSVREHNAAVDMLVGLDDAWVAPTIRRSLAGALPDRYLAKILKS